MEINIMSAEEAKKRSREVNRRKIEDDIMVMLCTINRAAENGYDDVWLGYDDYCKAAFDAVLPVLKKKGYCVKELDKYVEVSWDGNHGCCNRSITW